MLDVSVPPLLAAVHNAQESGAVARSPLGVGRSTRGVGRMAVESDLEVEMGPVGFLSGPTAAMCWLTMVRRGGAEAYRSSPGQQSHQGRL